MDVHAISPPNACGTCLLYCLPGDSEPLGPVEPFSVTEFGFGAFETVYGVVCVCLNGVFCPTISAGENERLIVLGAFVEGSDVYGVGCPYEVASVASVACHGGFLFVAFSHVEPVCRMCELFSTGETIMKLVGARSDKT